MSTKPLSHSESFDAFRARYLPLIRPEETLSRMKRALSVDAEFLGEFEILRRYLRPMMEGWADSLLGYLTKFPEFNERFGFEEDAQLRPLMREHAKQLAAGHFDEKYLTSLENIALFFIYHDVKSIWVAGAYQAITREAIDTPVPPAVGVGEAVVAVPLSTNEFDIAQQAAFDQVVRVLVQHAVVTLMTDGKQQSRLVRFPNHLLALSHAVRH